MNRVLILNGAPRSGKDTLSKMLLSAQMFERTVPGSFKRPLQDVAAALLGMSIEDFLTRYEEIKDLPCENGWPLTVRQLMIKISEEWVKPLGGKEYFGRLAYANADHPVNNAVGRQFANLNPYAMKIRGVTAVFTDGGFGPEVVPFIETLGAENVHIVRIHRPGFTFDSDSRTLLDAALQPELTGCRFYDIQNDASEIQMLSRFMDIVFYPLMKESMNGLS
jgi:hypothetical protein